MSPRPRLRPVALLASLCAVGVFCSWALAPPRLQAAEVSPGARLSLLALGDTGTERGWVEMLDPGLAVADALAREDRASPVDGIVLLGDNFYPDGLRKREFKERLRLNLVDPFCHFIQLTARGHGSFEDACDVPVEERHPVPIHALLGNHDYSENESPRLQRKAIPEYVANWDMPESIFEVRELPGGVSLILLDSMRWVRGAGGKELIGAVRRSRGPWRIVAAHHPMVDTGSNRVEKFEGRLARMLTEARVPVHLFLAGHEHNLQVIERPDEWPRLHVVSGSGSSIRELADGDPGRLFALADHGFARIDVTDDPPHLLTTMYRVPLPILGSAEAEPVARYSVDPDGNVSELPLPRR